MSAAKDVLQKLLSDPDIAKSREAVVRYLAAYRVVEQNLGLFDKLARCRDLSEFTSAVYEAVRVKERVLEKLVEGVREGDYEVAFQYSDPRELYRVFDFGQEHLANILKLAGEDPRTVGAVIASMALAYGGVRARR